MFETAIGLAYSALCGYLPYGISVGVKKAAYVGLLISQFCVCVCVCVCVCRKYFSQF